MSAWIVLSCLLAVPPVDVPGPTAEQGATMLGPGRVDVYVFDPDGLPFPQVSVTVDGRASETGDDGVARFRIVEGIYPLIVTPPASPPIEVIDVYVEQGKVTEVMVTLRSTGAPWIDVESPPLPPMLEPEDGKTGVQTQGARSLSTGMLEGELKVVETGAPVEGAQIVVRGLDVEAVSDASGHFRLALPVGTWSISVVHPRYAAHVERDIVISEAAPATVALTLTPAAMELEAFVVTAPHIEGSIAASLAARKNATDITEVLGAAEIARSGDSDAAGALRRVTGLTVVGGRYVYVRGLGERYSSTLLNGAGLPSPEPERRVVPLDLFPTSVLSGVTIRKTYSPELPGEFGGGAVELTTRGFPEAFLVKSSVGLGMTTGTTGRLGPGGPGGLLDVVGIDDGTRALPAEIAAASAEEELKERDQFSQRGYTASELEKFGEQLRNVWTPRPVRAMPDLSLGAEVGDRFELGKLTFGYLAGFTFGNERQRLGFDRKYLLVGSKGLEEGHAYRFEELETRVRLGGVATFGLRYGDDHEVTATSILGRTTTDEARFYQGFNRDVGGNIRVGRLRWVERTLAAQQIFGRHAFPMLWGLEGTWRYTYALALRHEPDRREVRFDQEPTQPDRWLLSDRPEGNQRVFSELIDHNHDLGAELRWPFQQWNGLDGDVKMGVAFNGKTRAVDTRRFKFQHKGPLSGDTDVLSRDAESIFVPEHIGAEGFQLGEITRPTDNYAAHQLVGGMYVSGSLPIWNGVAVAGGLRLEGARQYVQTFAPFSPDAEPVVAELHTVDVLPGVAATLDLEQADWLPDWRLLDGMKIRAAGSLTVSRPDFRELSPATFNDVTGGRQTFGNPELNPSRIAAGDLRWEWYPSSGTQLSAAVFYKHFFNPIEQIVVVSAQHSVTYANALAADNLGAELEARTDLGFVTPWLDGLFVAGNAAVIYSQVTLSDDDSSISTSKQRPLQGQSPWVANVQAGYDNGPRGTKLVALYNVFGPRISSVGALGVPDMYERPFHRVDIVFKQRLVGGISASLKAENLVDLPAVMTQGGQVTSSVRYGRSLSGSLSWGW
jgi:hypothetical protein